MIFAYAPVSVAGNDSGWKVSFDTSAYGEGTLSVEIFDVGKGYAPEIKWTRGAGSIKADKTGAQLFGSGDYYAVVQYEAGSSGDSTTLSDAQIEAEFDKYWIAQYGSIPEEGGGNSGSYPSGYPYWGRDDALDWYGEILEDEDFIEWLEDEGWDMPLPTADELVAFTESSYSYDPEDPDQDPDLIQDEIDADIVEAVNEIAEAWMDYTGADPDSSYLYNLYNIPVEQKRAQIMQCIQYPEYYIQMGYTPPGAGGSDAFVKSVVHLLTASEKANGLTVGSSFFDACVLLEITPLQAGTEYDFSTYQEVPVYADTAVWRVFGDIAVPSAIKVPEQNGDDDTETVDPIMEGLIGNLYGRGTASIALTGLVDTDIPFYAEPGSYIVTAAVNAGTDEDEPSAVMDWETVTVTNNGGSVSFAGQRSYSTVNITGSSLTAAPNINSIKISLGGGDVKSASIEAELFCLAFDANTYSYSAGIEALRVKAGSYSDAMITCAASNIDAQNGILGEEAIVVCSFWDRTDVGTLLANASTDWAIPKLSQTETNFTASLEFSGENGETAPFGEGTAVNGRMVLSAGGWELAGAAVMKQNVQTLDQYNPLGFDDISVLATVAEYADGVLITRPAGVEHTWFSFTAPEESATVNAHAYLSSEGIAELSFDASAVLDTGVGSGETVALGSAEFSAAVGSIQNGYMTLAANNTGSLKFTYTPEAGQDIPQYVNVKLVYLDTAGNRKNTSVRMTGTQTFTGTVSIPEDAAILESAVFSSQAGNLLVKNLSAMIVLANAEVSLDASGYELASEFDALKVIYGRKIYTMPKTGSVFKGLCPRGAYSPASSSDGVAVFFIANEPFMLNARLGDYGTAADRFAVDTSKLADKIRVDVLGDYREDDIFVHGKFAVDGRTVSAGLSSNYIDAAGCHFYLERSAGASAAQNIELTVESNNYSYSFTSNAGEATDFGIRHTISFNRGESFSLAGSMRVRNLDEFMYMEVLCGPDGTTPAQEDLSFYFYGDDGSVSFGSWYWRTKQLETTYLSSGTRYRLEYRSYGGEEDPFDYDEIYFTPVFNGENRNAPLVLTLREKAAVKISALFYSDAGGVPGSGRGELSRSRKPVRKRPSWPLPVALPP